MSWPGDDGEVPARQPVLVACAHGTRTADGQATYLAIAEGVRAASGLRVECAFVDVQEPAVGELVERLDSAGERVVVVPLLLSYGFHVGVDVAKAVAGRTACVAAAHLGPADLLTDVLVERLAALDVDAGTVVLAAAGSSDPAAIDDTTAAAALLSERIGIEVVVGYGASAKPTVAETVERARRQDAGPVVVASYLLAPGYFHGLLSQVGADAVTAPLCSPSDIPAAIVELILARYTAAVTDL